MHRFRKKISMEIPGSPIPSSYVARCPVQLYEATGSSGSWMEKGAAGELHVKSLGNAVLFLQLLSFSDSQLLFEDTIYNSDSLIVLSPRFFAIQLKNGNFQGFGFSDSAAASEMKEHISKAFKPHSLEEHSDRKSLKEMSVVNEKDNRSVSWISAANDSKSEEKGFAVPSLELVTYSQTVKSSKWRFSWKWMTSFPYSRNWDSISGTYGWHEHEMQIGYPTDVKHVAHIGWEGPSVCRPSWIEELKLSPDHAKRSPRELDQAMGSNRTHETLLLANCTSIGMDTIGQKDEFGSLPAPPAMYLDLGMPHLRKKHSWWNVSWLLHRSRDSSIRSCQA